MTMVEMIVNMDCHGCERKVRKALQNLDGVESIEIDREMQKVTVTGWDDQEKILKRVRRTGKKAELWPFPNNVDTIGNFTQHYYEDMYSYHSDPSTFFHAQRQPYHINNSTHNYGYEHRDPYNYNDMNDRLQQTPPYRYSIAGVGEKASIAFNDENVNACSVM